MKNDKRYVVWVKPAPGSPWHPWSPVVYYASRAEARPAAKEAKQKWYRAEVREAM